jgi:hypothetical protein
VPFLIVKTDWRATNLPPTPTISPNTSNQNFEIAILFNVVEKSGNEVFEDDPPSYSSQGKSFKLCPEGIKVFFIESILVKTSKRFM